MIKDICDICDKVIEGYNQKHCDFLMMQHKLIHRKESKVSRVLKKTKKVKTIKESDKIIEKPKEEKDYVWKEVLRDSGGM